jgi:multidrug efflux pump subunit AcrB
MIKTNENKSGDFFKFTTTRPVAILMVVIGVCVFGWISYQQLPLNLMPDITYPSLTVRTEYAGTAPEEVETTISRPIEQELGVVDNLVSIQSISKAGQSDVILEFTWDTDMNKATADLREKLDQVWLPEEVKRPIILRYDPSLDPIMRLGIYGESSLFYLRYLAEEDIKRKLETLDGVAAVKVKGGLEEEIRVELDEQKLTIIGIDIQQIKNRLAQENINLAGGNLKEGQTEYLVRTLNEFKSVSEIGEVVIGNWNGKEIKINDIGKVIRTNKEREIITRINGKENVEIEIFKEADANIVTVAKTVSAAIFGTSEQQEFVANLKKSEAEAKDKPKGDKKGESKRGGRDKAAEFQKKQMTNFVAYQLPETIKIEKLADQSIFIENAVNEVKNTAIIGGILAIIILFVFLRNLVVTTIIGISIPISIIATFAPMKIFDVSLNIMSLGGLALGIGMLVDNSIVVLESISRCREEGDDLIQATIRGVGEVGSAVFASTLTTIAVFFPIVFVEGIAGQVFGDMSLTVVFSLLASLATAVFLIPMLASREVSSFISGTQIQNIFKNNFLHFKTEPEIETILSDDQNDSSWFLSFKEGLLKFGLTLVETLFKQAILLFSLLVVLMKYITLPFILLATLVMFVLRKIGWAKNNFTETTIKYASNSEIFDLKYINEIWPDFLVTISCIEFINNLIKTRYWLLTLFPFVFYLIVFIFKFLVEIAFRLIHYFFMAITVLIKSIVLLSKLIFHYPVKISFIVFNWFYDAIEKGYPNVLDWSLQNKSKVIGSVSLLFVFTLFVLGPQIGSELIPEVHQGEFNLELTLPVGTPAEKTDERVLPIQKFISEQDGVAEIASVIGVDKSESTNTDDGEHTAKFTITIKREGSVIDEEERLIKTIRGHMSEYSGIQSKISRPTLFSFKTPIEVEIYGYNLQEMQNVAEKVESEMKKIDGLQDVKANIQRGNPEVQIVYNRQILSRYGLNILDVASIVRNKVRGDIATEFKEEDRKIDILVRVREEDKESIDNLRRMIINPGSPIPLPLDAVADIKVNEGPSEVRRIDQQRVAVITANISGRDLRSVSEDIFLILSKMEMPDDFSFELAGQNKEMETSLNSLMLALALAVFLVYIVMASQFESLLHPFIIIFTIPLALIGVIIFLYLLNIPLSIVVFLGLIMLAGIVVNNAIVLVDYINQLRDRGMEKIEAIKAAGKIRLRPIMMTTSTTVLGLLPMAIGIGDGSEIRSPMAITVIVGLITATLLTLVVIPTVYAVLDRKN